jgi:hypothetical protein
MTTNKKPSGYVLYRGASLLDGAPIVAIAIIKSTNVKTGNMVQTYILADNGLSPLESAKSGADISICGDCKHRRYAGELRDCYVNIGQGANAVYKAYLKGNYPAGIQAAANASAARMVRLGTYGDPAAVPAYVWQALISKAEGHTGYSHQWQNGKAGADIMALCMASADNAAERAAAKAAGYRTFRVRGENEAIEAGEFICPASAEGNKRKLCGECGACDGGLNSKRADPVIIVHGSLKSRFIPIMAAA